MARNKKPVNNNFGKGVEVIVINHDSPYLDQNGFIETGNYNKDGEYSVKLASGESVLIHANDLDTYDPATEGLSEDQKPRLIIVREAALKDDLCNYKYEVASGLGMGDSHSVAGSGIIYPDLHRAFRALDVHLACIDDVFKHSGIDVTDIDKFHGEELTGHYTVLGFKVSGGSENEAVILIGNKYVSQAGGRIEMKTPKIPIDNTSSYPWYNELKKAIDTAREEVELYRNGKYTVVDRDEDEDEKQKKTKTKQLTIGDAIADNADAGGSDKADWDEEQGAGEPASLGDDFESARI